MSMRARRIFVAALIVVWSVSPFAGAQTALDENILKNLTFRNLGPFRAGSWVTAFAVPTVPAREHLYTLYVGARNGGLWKTVNAGTTFEPIFDAQSNLSIGDVAVAPTDANIVWVGTGEAANARSSHSGDGLYKSTDAGKTWTHMGLADSHHIARVIIHPKNPETVYVASMGHLFTTNAERGVFKTTDGGTSWTKVLYIDERVGAVDLAIVEAEPDTLYAATYEKVRLPWTYELGGPESAIYKTTDGGKSWNRLAGGLPTGRIGRIGLDVYQKNPNILCAVIENGNKRELTPKEAEMVKRRGGGRTQVPTVGNEVFRSDDAGTTWHKINAGYEQALDKSPYAFNQLRLDPEDPGTIYITGQSLFSTDDGGKTWKGTTWPPDGVMQKGFGDWRCMWIDPLDRNRLIFGSDGGVTASYDRGKTCRHYDNMPLTEWYAVGVDMEDPYNIYGGLQDHDSWKGPSNGWSGDISLADWITVGGGDGMYNCVDPTDSRWVYNNREMGTMWRLDQKNGVQTLITPRRAADAPRLRFNWTPPIALSPHNPAVVYTGAQVVFRSDDRGDFWREISPDLTTNDDAKQHGEGFVPFCTLTTLAESPAAVGVIWTGSDDGKVYVTRDGGATWLDRTAALASAGAPANYWVSRVFPSPHAAGTCFVSKTGWRLDEFKPCLYRTTDFGETWTSISGNLPPGKSINVVIQDRINPELLFVGTDHGVYVTIDGGTTWVPFKNNMPWVAVTDMVIHPRENDLIVATYGRGAWIADIAPLQEMKPGVLDENVHLFAVKPRTQRIYTVTGNYQLLGDSHLFTPNEPNAVAVNYYLKAKASAPVKVTVSDAGGKVLSEMTGAGEAGINTALWNMRVRKPGAAEWEEFYGTDNLVDPGEYLVKIETGGTVLTGKAVIRSRQGWTFGPLPVVIK
ncbi:MAG: VPS10 domain-containing protein [Candidatus Aminicenantales bacterium]